MEQVAKQTRGGNVMRRRGIEWGKLSKDETRKIIYSDKNSQHLWKNPKLEELKKEAIEMMKDRIEHNRKLRKRWH
jgi:hypothetical protein